MAILKCPQCGNKVSDKAEKCPHCGKMVSDFLALENSYQEAINIFQSNSSTSADMIKAKTIFIQLKNYKNSNELIAQCDEKINEINYQKAIRILKNNSSKSNDLLNAKSIFTQLGSYKDSNELTEKCDEAIAEVPLKEIYQQSDNLISEAKSLYDTSIKENIVKAISKLEQAEKSFTKLNKYRNSIEKATECRTKIQTYQGKIGELDELNKKAEQAKKHRNKIIVICASISIIVIATITLTVNFIIPSIKYNNAVAMLENGQYDEAITAFTDLGNYKDSINKITETQNAKTEFERNQKYDSANKLFEEKKYDEAAAIFEGLGDYKDSSEMKEYSLGFSSFEQENYSKALYYYENILDFKNSQEMSNECRYILGNSYLKNELYSSAINYFTKIADYKDADNLLKESYYLLAEKYLKEKSYTDAASYFLKITDYKDSSKKIQQIYDIATQKYQNKEFTDARLIYSSLRDFKDSKDMITKCDEGVLQIKKDEILNPFKNGQIKEALEKFKNSEFSNSSNFTTFMKDNGYQSQIEAYLNDFRKYEGLYLDTEYTSTGGFRDYYYYYHIYIDENSWRFSVHYIIGNETLDPYEKDSSPQTFAYDFQLGKTRYYISGNENESDYHYYEIDVNNGVLVNKYWASQFRYAYKQ